MTARKPVDYYPVPATNADVIVAVEGLQRELVDFEAAIMAKLQFLKESLGARRTLVVP